LFDNFTSFYDEDFIHFFDGGKPVSDDDRRDGLEKFMERILNLFF